MRKSSTKTHTRILSALFQFSLALGGITTVLMSLTAWTAVATGQSSTNLDNAAESSVEKPVGENNQLSAESIEAGWIRLFDGETLFGWKSASDANWSVTDGVIKADAGKSGLLRTTSQFSDYELRLDFKSTTETNSGVFLRTSPKPKSAKTACYEVNIAPADNPFPTGSVVARSRIKDVLPDLETWQTMRIIIAKDQGEVFINGKEVHQFESSDLGRGYIGLQFRSGSIEFKNVFLRPLNLDPLLSGKNLDSWTSDGANEAGFSLNEKGLLHMQSGPGQLESKKHFADFVLNARIKTNADGLNSGIFFRCIPSEKMNGYESQIQNQMIDDDPTKPFDCGTGGIFRRQNARRIVAKDQQWFHKTIVAVGPHVSVWVNGYQVSDWTDQRKPDPNPRKGLRLDPGSLMLQGHDPTTDILIQSINVSELSPRR